MRVHALLIALAITTILALPAMAPVIAQQKTSIPEASPGQNLGHLIFLRATKL
jgi:hypothetical protein